MIKILDKKFKLITVEHNWFADNIHRSKSAVQIYHDFQKPDNLSLQNTVIKEHITLITDLTDDEDTIFQGISKNYRYEIRRCGKEQIETMFFNVDYEGLSSDNLREFEKIYNEMFQLKGLPTRFNRNLLKSYMKEQAVCFSAALTDNNIMVFHAYITDGKTYRLLYSASKFRSDKEESALIGRMNKYLHWKDIKHIKSIGGLIYDWGGISNFHTPNGIDSFKMKFGGVKKQSTVIFLCNGIIGKLIQKRILK